MIRNPEFRRNLWLEVNPQRLATSPMLVVLLYALVVATVDEANARRAGAMAARGLFFIWAAFWGGAKVRGSFVSEVSERTWDTQRMSVLSPWTLAWGKILGSTILPWVGASMALVLFFYASAGDVATPVLLRELCAFVALALGFQGLVAFTTVLEIRRTELRRGVRGGSILSSVVALTLLGAALLGVQNDRQVSWYAASFSGRMFGLVSMVVWSGWAWLGVQRVLAKELQLRLQPWAWWSFLLFVPVFFGGFLAAWTPLSGFGAASVMGLGFGLVFTYVGAFFDRRDSVDLRAFWVAVRRTDVRQVMERLPLFVSPAVLALVCIVPASMACGRAGSLPSNGFTGWLQWTSDAPFALGALGATALFVVLRDVGFLYRFSLGTRPERAETSTLLLMFLLSVLLPALFGGLGGSWLAALALPFLLVKAPLAALGVAGLHLAIVGMMLSRRLARAWHPIRGTNPS